MCFYFECQIIFVFTFRETEIKVGGFSLRFLSQEPSAVNKLN